MMLTISGTSAWISLRTTQNCDVSRLAMRVMSLRSVEPQDGLDRAHRAERITDDEDVRLQQAATPGLAGQHESRGNDRHLRMWQFDVLSAAALRAARCAAHADQGTEAVVLHGIAEEHG